MSYYVVPISPQIADTNMTGHIDQLTLPVWFDRARTSLYREMDPTLRFHPHGLVVVHTEVRYLKEIDVSESGEVRTWTNRIGCKSYELTQEYWASGECKGVGVVAMCGFNLIDRKSEPLLPAYRAALERYFQDGSAE